jgi:AMME syndrome candidate gene 1 protein
MASSAHCFYCFEVLSASFDNRMPPTLQKVLDLYDEFNTATQQNDGVASEVGEEAAHGETIDGEASEEDMQRLQRRAGTEKSGLQIPSISRIQASSSSSRSSSQSSPSPFSANSSRSQLATPASGMSNDSSEQPTYASKVTITESYPLFVTWNTHSRSGHKSLRGCIGTFEALPLQQGLSGYALTSAFDDTRFSPIPASQLPVLSCALTLLANFEPCEDAMDWTLGTHGLRISFNYRNRRHGATYLPDVAVEQGWTKAETVESLMKKAGWDGGYAGGHGVARRLLRGSARGGNNDQQSSQPARPWEEVQDFKAIRYTGIKADATYAEWQEWRLWAMKYGLT